MTFDAQSISKMLIGGSWQSALSGATFEDCNPATGDVLTRLPETGDEDVHLAVVAATEAAPEWGAAPGRHRAASLERLAGLLERYADQLALLESIDNGRPLRETTAQAGLIPKFYRYFAGLADKIEGRSVPVEGPYLNYTTRVPVGVCAAITPWNHPQLIVAKKIAPALAAGNCVIVKPSELAPLSVLALASLSLEAGIPAGVLNVLTGGSAAGRALSVHPGVQRIDVTGSTRTGIAVATAAAPSMKRLGFELGGKAANVVFADADVERALRGVAFSGFIAQGQTCVAGSRALVDASIAPEFAEGLARRASSVRLGDPTDAACQMGPLITPQAAMRVREMVREAVAGGVKLLVGGEHPTRLGDGLRRDSYLQPTVLWAEDASQAIARDEVFGPVITVIPFESEEQAVEIANGTAFGLGSAIWTGDVTRAHRVAGRLRVGITWINDYHRVDPSSPWGGFGLSGYGRENGGEVLESYTEVKSVWVPLEQSDMGWYDTTDALRLN